MKRSLMPPKFRYAPSPTGTLHLGGLKSALVNYLAARSAVFHGRDDAKFLIRIEDTDAKRTVPGSAENIISTLEKFGIRSDEKVVFQSQRLHIYRQYAEELVEKKAAYYCFCPASGNVANSSLVQKAKPLIKLDKSLTRQLSRRASNSPEHINNTNSSPMVSNQANDTGTEQEHNHGHGSKCLICQGLGKSEIRARLSNNEPHVIRQKIFGLPEFDYNSQNNIVVVEDTIRGKVAFNLDTLDEQVLLKSDGFPTYHLAHVVDDYLMNITNVIRGEEWLPSAPKHVLLYKAFGWEDRIPQFSHISLLLSQDAKKLSKRKGALSADDYLAQGYLPNALLNYILLLGWSPKEIVDEEADIEVDQAAQTVNRLLLNLDEMAEIFLLEGLGRSGSQVDETRLQYFNTRHMEAKIFGREMAFYYDIIDNIAAYLGKDPLEIDRTRDRNWIMFELAAPRCHQAPDFVRFCSHFFRNASELSPIMLEGDEKYALRNCVVALEELDADDWEDSNRIAHALHAVEDTCKGRGLRIKPLPLLRRALTREKFGLPVNEILRVLGKEASLERLYNCKHLSKELAEQELVKQTEELLV